MFVIFTGLQPISFLLFISRTSSAARFLALAMRFDCIFREFSQGSAVGAWCHA
jgi:hypothetical protein